MSRKNRKKKLKNMHRKDLAKNTQAMKKFDDKVKEQKEVKDEMLDATGQAENGMEIEGQVPKRRKIRKNKLFQKRILLEERKRLKRIKKAPVERRREERMEFE